MLNRVIALIFTTILAAPNTIANDVLVERTRDSQFFQFPTISPPAINDDAAHGTWAVVRGVVDPNSAGLQVLNDGKIPSSDDSPQENFFFAGNTSARSIALDLGRSIELSEVTSYSWHTGGRSPQVYTLYGANDSVPGLAWNRLEEQADPSKKGWTKIAKVDSRDARSLGGQHACRITQKEGSLGTFRYLLFDIDSTDPRDPFGQTFFSEIDVLAKSRLSVERVTAPNLELIEFTSNDGRFEYSIDVTIAPNMSEWTERELKPVIQEWYPRIVEMLPSENFTAPTKIRFRYQPNSKMNGTPAYAQAATITLNSDWMYRERNREARGAVVHEMVHVVQSYQSRRGSRNATPGWIIEGIPDYIRWFLYEPQSKGAFLGKEALAQSKHDASYRVSANFIDWVIRSYDGDGLLLRDLNAVAREGRYTSEIWLKLTSKSESELAELWRNQ